MHIQCIGWEVRPSGHTGVGQVACSDSNPQVPSTDNVT